MKYINIFIVGGVLLFGACSPQKKVAVTNLTFPTAEVTKFTELSEVDQRKFDFYFFEALKNRLSGDFRAAFDLYRQCLDIDPKSSAVFYELGNILASTEAYDKSEDLLKSAVENNPGNYTYKELLGRLYLQNKKLDQALAIYKELSLKSPQNEDYLYYLSVLYEKNGQYKDAVLALESLEQKIGYNEPLFFMKNDFLLRDGKSKEVIQNMNRMSSKYPLNPKFFGFLGDFYGEQKQYQKAAEYFQKAVNTSPEGAIFYFNLGRVKLAANDTVGFKAGFVSAIESKDIEIEQKIGNIVPFLNDPEIQKKYDGFINQFIDVFSHVYHDNPASGEFLAHYYKSKDDKQKAAHYYKLAISADSETEGLWNDALIFFVQPDDVSDLVEYGKQATDLFPQNPFFKYLYAIGLHEQKKYDDAFNMLTEAEKLTPEDNTGLKLRLYQMMGDCLHSLNKASLSYEYYDKALAIDPNNLGVLNNYAYYLSLENRDLDKAEKMSGKCIELEMSNSTYLDTHAWVLFKQKKFFEAKFIIERAIDFNKENSAVIIEHYGDILFFNNDVDDAITQWKNALKISPDSVILKKKIENRQYYEENIVE